MVKKFKLITALLSALLISACTSEPSEDLAESIVESSPETDGALNPSALFDPSDSIIPFPNNLLLSMSDGTVNIPVEDDTDLANPRVALNAIDGFSTVAPISSGFSTSIDPASVNGTSVKVYQVILSGTAGAVVNPFPPGTDPVPLIYGVDFVASLSSVDTTQSTLVILPLKPLAPSTSYMVVITDDLMTTAGVPFGPSVTYRLIKNLPDPLVFGDPTLPGALQSLDMGDLALFDGIRQIVNVGEGTIAMFDSNIEISDIITSWSFTTQSIGEVLNQVRTDIRGVGDINPPPVTTLVDSTQDSQGTAASIFIGSIAVPYYLTAATGVNDLTPLGSYWKDVNGDNLGGNTLPSPVLSPEPTSTEIIPLMVTVPNPVGAGPYPVVIYQHGITTNRATVLAVADNLALRGFATVAIDLPLHGLTVHDTGPTAAFYNLNGIGERTFDLNLVTQDPDTGDIIAQTPDNRTDSSGRHYINLSNLLNSRDNLRQSVSDLFALTYAIGSLTDGTVTFDDSKIYFLGHSLGAIVGTTFTALEDDIQDAVFAFGGGGVPKILDGSAAFGPSIAAGLAVNGIIKGTPDYESFLGLAQSVVDSGDPINYASEFTDNAQGVLYFEIVGGNSSPSDLVVPNTVPDTNDSSNTVPSLLAGTEPVLTLMGLTQVNSTQGMAPFPNLRLSVKFTAGSHSSILDPTPDPAVFAEIQSQMAEFLFDDGRILTVVDDTVLQVPPPP